MGNNRSQLKNRNIKWFILCGAIGALIFTFSWIIQETFIESYNPLMAPVSSLVLGPFAWIQTATFLITGILIVLFAFGLFNTSKSEYKGVSKWAPILIAICGIGLIGAGCFATDPMNGYPEGTPLVNENPSLNSIIHQLFSSFLFFGIPIASFIFGNYFANKKELKWLIYSFLSGIIFLIAFLITSMGFSQVGGLQYYAGLLQRFTLTVGFAWLALLSIYFFKKQ
jgi:hypothetical protein